MTALRRWQDLTTVDFESLDPNRTVAVLPVGAIEQHGPHLPVATDALVAGAVAEALAELAESDRSAFEGEEVEVDHPRLSLSLRCAHRSTAWTPIPEISVMAR